MEGGVVPVCRLIGLLAIVGTCIGTHARSEDRECTRYLPEIARTVRVRCGGDEVPDPAVPASPEAAVPPPRSGSGALRGLTLAKLTPALRQKYNVDASVDGVIVTGVDAQSVAADRVMPGDVIMQTNQGVVATPDDVVRNLDIAAKDGRKAILLLLKKASGELRFVALPLG
jgi:hypothetical protein